jgi:hypothetical protein
VERLTAERDEALDKLDAMTAERDALRARIEAGVVVWGSYQSGGLCFVGEGARDETDTHTALLIDAAPIAEDERKGERRKANMTSPYYRRKSYFNDRRRTPGTRADRGKV